MTAYLTGFADFTGSFILGQEAKQPGTTNSRREERAEIRNNKDSYTRRRKGKQSYLLI